LGGRVHIHKPSRNYRVWTVGEQVFLELPAGQYSVPVPSASPPQTAPAGLVRADDCSTDRHLLCRRVGGDQTLECSKYRNSANTRTNPSAHGPATIRTVLSVPSIPDLFDGSLLRRLSLLLPGCRRLYAATHPPTTTRPAPRRPTPPPRRGSSPPGCPPRPAPRSWLRRCSLRPRLSRRRGPSSCPRGR
jgi:hypothetical protein